MDGTKSLFASTTFYATLLQALLGVGIATGVVNAAVGDEIVKSGPDIILGVVNAGLAVWAMYGRIRATKTIG